MGIQCEYLLDNLYWSSRQLLVRLIYLSCLKKNHLSYSQFLD